MANRVVDEEAGTVSHPVRPEHIDAKPHFWDAFGNQETEVSAQWVVRLCQKLGGWNAFTENDIEGIYRKAGYLHGFRFNRLLGGDNGFIVQGQDGRFRVTHEFICRCFGSSPSKAVFTRLQPA